MAEMLEYLLWEGLEPDRARQVIEAFEAEMEQIKLENEAWDASDYHGLEDL